MFAFSLCCHCLSQMTCLCTLNLYYSENLCLPESNVTIILHPYMFALMMHHYLNRSVQVGSFESKVDLGCDWQADEQPVVKTEVVDQLEDVGHGQVEQRHGTLGR